MSESSKKEFYRIYESLQNIAYDILVFLKCELMARVFLHMREMTVRIILFDIIIRELSLLASLQMLKGLNHSHNHLLEILKFFIILPLKSWVLLK